MKVVIAEKPSVARDIATILGATEKKDGYITGNGFSVTWAFGHLVQLAMPEEYGAIGFKKDHLPILPQDFKLVCRQIKDGKEWKDDAGVKKQLDIIAKLFNECTSIIVATDAGREGELIFRYIYNYLNCNKPYERLWISSLTDSAIKDGIKNLKPGKEYDNLYFSAKSRSEADWLVGINASQAITISAGGGVYSLGRVQTPTLALICNRFNENKAFKPIDFWQLQIELEKDSILFNMLSDRIDIKENAEQKLQLLQKGEAVNFTKVEKKEVKENPPLLFDLTALQKECNKKFSLSADQTLSIAQGLYERKFITYPRTGSAYISQDVFDELPKLIEYLQNHETLGSYASKLKSTTLNKRSVNDSKVTDHHALLTTENQPNLTGDEKKVYDQIARRVLQAFSDVCIKDSTSLECEIQGISFTATGSVIRVPGWRTLDNKDENDNKEKDVKLPELSQGEILEIQESTILSKKTKPKPLYTESSLLSAMENCGKEVEDKELKSSLSAGIGTPATRASVIETLIKREYIMRDKKSVIPTDKGLAVYNIVKDNNISNVEMTGEWESKLAEIETSKLDSGTFISAIKDYASTLTNELLACTSIASTEKKYDVYKCPKCGKESVHIWPKATSCKEQECDFVIFREIAKKTLTDNQIKELLQKGKTSSIKGFTSKAGKKFDVKLKLNTETKRVEFDFDKK